MSVPADQGDALECCASYLAVSIDLKFLLDRRAEESPDIWPENARLAEMPTRRDAKLPMNWADVCCCGM